MLQSIRNLITTRLAIFNSTSPWLLRPFSTTTPLARQNSLVYPDEATRIRRYKSQLDTNKTRYRTDPIFRAKRQEFARARHKQLINDERVRLRITLWNWLKRGSKKYRIADLPWKTHVPVLYKSKVEHYCHGCDWTRTNGMMLWWRRRKGAGDDKYGDADGGTSGDEVSKSDEYLCPGCYVNTRTRFEALPEGYEDVRGIKDIVARKKQLEELATAASDTSK